MSDSNASPRRPARANASSWLALLIWIVAAVVTAVAIRLQFQWGRAWSASGEESSFDALTPLGRWALNLFVVVLWLGATIWIGRATGRRRLAVAASTVLLGTSLVVGWGLAEERSSGLEWHEVDRLTTRDRGVYVALWRITPYHTEFAIARSREPGVVAETIDIVYLCYPMLDAPIALVPDGTDVRTGMSLAVLPAGGIAVLERDQARDEVSSSVAIDADGGPSELAPFDLFDAHDTGDPRDVERWCDWLTTGNRRGKCVDSDALRDALDHPNPWVRAAAAKLLAAHAEWESAQTEVR